MKHTFCALGLALALSFSAAQPIFSQTVSLSEAEKVAINFMKTQNFQVQNIASHSELSYAEITSGALIYVFNFQSGGFALVAGDKKSTPILGYSDKNTFDLGNLSPEVSYFLDEMKNHLATIKKDKKQSAKQTEWNLYLENKGVMYGAESETIVGPYLTTTWNQGQYYNQNCPADNMGPASHALTGCVATAMAQVIKYHNSPAFGTGTHEYLHGTYGWLFADFENTQYNWSNMPNQLTSNNNDVATLLYHCGVAVNMDYGPNGSGANQYNVVPALINHFNFTNAMSNIKYDNASPASFILNIANELNAGRPVIMVGYRPNEGHAWVCDGYQSITGMPLPMYYHMNWGWGGGQDGYFQLGDFNSFNSHVMAIIGIEPSCPRNVSLTDVILAGTPVEVIENINVNVPVIPFMPTIYGKNVSYDAGKSIMMTPGFLADGNTVTLKAYIQGCGGPAQLGSGGNEERSQEELAPAQKTEASEVTLSIFPNPFSATTTISYVLPADKEVDIKIFNAMGNLVRQPAEQEAQTAGTHEYTFEANDLPNGVYFLVMQTDGQKLSKRLVLAR